jgi:predicted 3-demethylubiquinone-9 3-methyltransferase (glyoxalase superfamily)
MPSGSPSGPPGAVKIVEFVLIGEPFIAMSAGRLDPFNHAVSFVVNCSDQCGWLKDRFGLSWQIVPTALIPMMADPDREKAKRAADAMMTMVKLDIEGLPDGREADSR